MKKLFAILLVSLFVGVSNLSAQTYTDTITEEIDAKYYYCELVGLQKAFSTKVVVSIDFGQETKLFEDTRLRDKQTGKIVSFNSMIDALNFLGDQGWEFVQAYITNNGTQYTYHWLLKKKKIRI